MSATELVTIHLLDSAQGHPVQTWRFRDKHLIVVGRSEDCDIVIADAHVSRNHVRLQWDKGAWTLISLGRHGTLVSDHLVAETQLGKKTTFRLGANGPTLRFECGATEGRPSETIDSIQPDLIAMLEIDEQRKLQEADDIAGNSLFASCRTKSAELGKARPATRKSADRGDPGDNSISDRRHATSDAPASVMHGLVVS